jgi:formylglycine-generating enzyme required for sulfatase activity
MKTRLLGTMITVTLMALANGGASAAQTGGCATDSVLSGTVCIDKYEASVWRVPDPDGAGKRLVRKIQQGTATVADLLNGGATQLGAPSDNYAPCENNGENCAGDIFAVSLPGVKPATLITWFQAQQACSNALKRLPTNAEWQAAVAGTPDPGPDDQVTDCNTTFVSGEDPTPAGSRTSCVSARGAFDMVGNLQEWVADWLPRSTSLAGSWSPTISATGDYQFLGGAATEGEPGALLRGGSFLSQAGAGPLSINGYNVTPSTQGFGVGFRCVR